MAIVTFWSDIKKETAQTSSILAIATHLANEKNLRILLIDGNFSDETITKAYWAKKKENRFLKQLNRGKMDIGSGADGLVSAIASNKATPEIIANYTKVVYNNRLDVLPGLRTQVREEFDKSLVFYSDLLFNANKFYDIVLLDLDKTTEGPAIKKILDSSNIIIYTMSPNTTSIDRYVEAVKKYDFMQKNNVIPILGRSDELSVNNPRNVAKKIGERMGLPFVPYNVRYAESTYEGGISNYFFKMKTGSKDEDQKYFVEALDFAIERIQYKIQELQIR